MPKTTYLDNPSRPGTCKHCGEPADSLHYGDRFGTKGDVCDKSRAYVWRTFTAKELPVMTAALERLKSYTLGDHANLRIVDRTATGDDSWEHAYGYDKDLQDTHAVIMNGWSRQYNVTIDKMNTAYEFFQHGWNAHVKAVAAQSKKVNLKHEAQWVVCLGTRINYQDYTSNKPVASYAKEGDKRWPAGTFDLDKAHSFKSRKEAQAFVDNLVAPSELYGDEVWSPVVGQRNDFR